MPWKTTFGALQKKNQNKVGKDYPRTVVASLGRSLETLETLEVLLWKCPSLFFFVLVETILPVPGCYGAAVLLSKEQRVWDHVM